MKRDPNLFEAFKDAASSPAPPVGAAKKPAARSEPRGTQGTRLIVLACLCLAIVFAAGYFTGGGRKEVEAKGETEANKELRATWQPAGPAPLGGTSDGERAPARTADPAAPPPKSTVSGLSALYNPENLYTVLAITYRDFPSMQGQARDIAEFLRQHDLPAFEPISRAGDIEILVGAAATQGALQELTAKLRGTRGPTGRSFDFQSAYVVNIDDHLDRD
jgi:hypothetical protein